MTTSEVLFSRPTSAAWGKATETLKTLVPEDVKADFAQVARRMGYASDSDALREIVMVFTYGPAMLRSVHVDRIDGVAQRMAGIGTTEVRS